MKFKEWLAEEGHEVKEPVLNEDGTVKEEGTSAETLAGFYNDFNEAKHKALEEAITAKNEELITELKEELKTSQIDQLKALNDALKAQGVAIKKLTATEKQERSEQGSVKDSLTANAAKLTAMARTMKNTPDVNSVREGEFSFKVAADMLISTNVSGGNVPVEQRLAGMNAIASRNIRLMDLVSRGTAESNVISWVYQANKDGAAGGTAEGATKNQIDFDLVVDSETVKKRTAYIKISDEMIGDIDFMASEINNELMRELMKDIENQVYQGDGTGTNLNGINTVATAFAAGSFATEVDNANKVDVLRVALNQIAIAEQGSATAILMHPSDVTSLLLEKVTTTDKRYIMALQEIASTRTLDGIPIVETTLVTVDDYLVGNFPLATVYDRGSIDIQVGLDGNDFTKNMRTVRAEWRGLVIVKNNDRTAFVTGDFTTDEAALETP